MDTRFVFFSIVSIVLTQLVDASRFTVGSENSADFPFHLRLALSDAKLSVYDRHAQNSVRLSATALL